MYNYAKMATYMPEFECLLKEMEATPDKIKAIAFDDFVKELRETIYRIKLSSPGDFFPPWDDESVDEIKEYFRQRTGLERAAI